MASRLTDEQARNIARVLHAVHQRRESAVSTRKVVRPHPSTVTAVSQGEKRKRRSPGQPSGRSSRVTVRNLLDDVHPAAREVVLELADGNLSRVEVVSPTEVLIHNPGWGRS